MATPSRCPGCKYSLYLTEVGIERCPRCGRTLRAEAVPSVLSGPLVPSEGPNIRKRRSILRENLKFFAVFIPLVLLATAVIFVIISWVQSMK